ncbi:hypothetical protein [Streptomyces caniferus]|uniref:hypothetical protein n=1 Tax=Streptomyces caniferus TaxID=285557 RepID=UPI003823ABAE
MDQGMAALLGAAVGVAGTLGAAALSYLAVRSQAPDQARVDHAKQIRSERRDAYAAFLEKAEEPVSQAILVLGPIEMGDVEPPGARQLAEMMTPFRRAADELLTMTSRIQLCGPEEVAQEAVCLWSAIAYLAYNLGDAWEASGESEQFSRALAEVEVTREKFIAAARAEIERVPR